MKEKQHSFWGTLKSESQLSVEFCGPLTRFDTVAAIASRFSKKLDIAACELWVWLLHYGYQSWMISIIQQDDKLNKTSVMWLIYKMMTKKRREEKEEGEEEQEEEEEEEEKKKV